MGLFNHLNKPPDSRGVFSRPSDVNMVYNDAGGRWGSYTAAAGQNIGAAGTETLAAGAGWQNEASGVGAALAAAAVA